MVDSIRPVKRPTRLQDYTKFMEACVIDAMKGFNPDGSAVSFDEGFKKCREAWIESKGEVNSGTPDNLFVDTDFLIATEEGGLLLTENLDYIRTET